ncbi:helicase-exonuclease AddAB subunit AddB [Brevibacillus fulvus]|uniref:ATP-dependent helicase/deoxyribonuclease subunit B n=1 Tax=Brevibacillus fulvus TaxID=1125967 RepID=A0A938Y0G2_9BACL|nr:helicase-exonuclease AddAB subunit AddB [Brevibacillus fulvus]MBM7591086.1 ATP-dependent helicase/nuclease subunit B [Brevibacillus fulvus]
MSLQFVIGRAGTGKTSHILGYIHSRLKADPAESTFIYIVPEQGTFQAEYALATLPELGGVIGSQVLSFNRLAYRLLQELGGMTLLPVDERGKQMVLRMLLERYKDQLQMFQRSAQQPGFVNQLGRMISECKSYGVIFHDLDNLDWGSASLTQKIKDISLIMNAYEAYLSGIYYDTDDMLTRVATLVGQSEYLRQAEIFIDGFSGFTNQEYRMIEQLMVHAKRVTVALSLDPLELAQSTDELALFAPTLKTYHRLAQIAREVAVPLEAPIVRQESYRFAGAPLLAKLEKSYFAWDALPVNAKPARTDELCLVAAVNRRAEVEAAALQILSLVRDHGYHWRDIAILLREMGIYADEIEAVFTEYGIPFFLDQKRTVLHHPLIELIRSSLEVIVSRWRYEAVFRCLKTDLVTPAGGERPTRLEVDLLENYVLAYGIQAYHWSQETDWSFHARHDQDAFEIDAIRRRYAAPLLAFEREMKQAEQTDVRALTTVLYRFLLELGVPQKLAEWQEQAEAAGELETAREHGQVWNDLLELLDQIVEVMGGEQIELATYARILDSGLESIQLGLVPPALDQVLIGSMERSRQPDVKALLILGANDGLLPARPVEEGILDEAEREHLAALGIELAPSARQRLMEEQYLLYQAFTRPSERLWLSCSLADEEGKALLPSPVFERLQELFPELTLRYFYNEPTGEAQQDSFLLGRPDKVFGHLLTLLREFKKGQPLSPFWWEIYDWFVRSDEQRTRQSWLLSGLNYDNRVRPLSKEISAALYGRQLRMSVSRLERFQACPFSHFSSHGLRLTERELFKLERFDVGELFHASLKRAVEVMKDQHLEWERLSEAESMTLADEVVEEVVPQTRSSILTRTARYRYLSGKLKRAVGRAIYVLGEHARRSHFAPVGLEVKFGPGGDLPGLTLPLDQQSFVQLIGRIDRVDLSIDEDRPYLRVIDYKSGAKRLALSDIWNGLNLQLLVYLDVVFSNAEQWLGKKAEIGGVFYYQVADPFVTAKRMLAADEVAKQRTAKLKMKGLMLADPDVARLMDQQVESGSSELLPFGLKKDGTFSAYSSVATAEQFQLLQQHVRDTVRELSARMIAGDIQIDPYTLGTFTACETCSFKAVCQYDQQLSKTETRVLGKWKDQEIWQKLADKFGGGCQDEQQS